MRQDKKPRCILFKKGQIFSVASPDMQLFDQQNQRNKYKSNIQKQYINKENSDCS